MSQRCFLRFVQTNCRQQFSDVAATNSSELSSILSPPSFCYVATTTFCSKLVLIIIEPCYFPLTLKRIVSNQPTTSPQLNFVSGQPLHICTLLMPGDTNRELNANQSQALRVACLTHCYCEHNYSLFIHSREN